MIEINEEEFCKELRILRAQGYSWSYTIWLTTIHFPPLRYLVDKVKAEEAQDAKR